MESLFQLLVDIVRAGAEYIVAVAVGFVLFLALWWFVLRNIGNRDREHPKGPMANVISGLAPGYLEGRIDVVERENVDLRSELEIARKAEGAASKQVRDLQEHRDELISEVEQLSHQLQDLAEFDGKVWEKQSVCVAPEFVEVSKDRPRFLAVVNLKGGVGKSTLAANIGATLASNGKRTLLFDLDYQASLSSLCLSPAEMESARRQGLLMEELFLGEASVAQLALPVPSVQKLEIIPAHEPLAEVENRLMAQWLLDQERDVRFILRDRIHQRNQARGFDYVIADCPPRLTTACVNALTACDGVLIPVLLDQTSSEAVPRLLTSLRKFRNLLSPELRVLGLIGNRAHPWPQLIAREQAVWSALPSRCAAVWGDQVHLFETVIKQNAAIAEACASHTFAAFSPKVQAAFRDLTDEILMRCS